uniref:Uncharacterized protein n=1 Tax=Anguilla anguilla TaxID=7936 RepID=A0A0E9WNT4_ANGAN
MRAVLQHGASEGAKKRKIREKEGLRTWRCRGNQNVRVSPSRGDDIHPSIRSCKARRATGMCGTGPRNESAQRSPAIKTRQ